MPQLARRMSRAKPSVIMQVAEKAKRLKAEGRDIISFSIGVPNFLPGEHVYAAAREALAKEARGDANVTTLMLPAGGHNYHTYAPYLPQSLTWLANQGVLN